MNIKNKIIKNTFWLLGERIINILGLIFVTSYVAKYLGPDNFGKLSLATYIYSLIQTIAIWGSDTISVKRISRNKSSGLSMLMSLRMIRVPIFIIAFIPTEIYIYITSDKLTLYYSLAVALSSLIAIQDFFVIANDATYNSKYNVITNVIGVFISFLVRYLIVLYQLDIVFFCLPIVLLNLVPYMLRYFNFRVNNKITLKLDKSRRKFYFKYVLASGLPIVISSVSVAIYFNTSRLMLGAVESVKSLGIYSVAITLGSSWGFVNNAFITSITPKLYSKDSVDKTCFIAAFMSQFVIVITFLYAVFFFLLGDFIINSLYGYEYLSSFYVTFPLILSTGLSGLGMVTTRYIINYNGYSFLGRKATCVCVLGLFISYFFIKIWGMLGAAISTLAIEFISLTVMNYFFKGCSVFKMHLSIFKLFNYKNL